MKKIYILSLLLVLFNASLISQANLIASYNFNGGSAADNSGNGKTGTFYGSSSVVDTLTIGYNTTDYFTVPASVLNTRVQFSIMFKIKFTGFNLSGSYPTNSIFSADNSSTSGVFALSYQKDVTKWRVGNNVVAFDFVDNSIVTGKWYCVTLTRDNAGNMKLYVDGTQNPTVNVYTTPISITSFIVGQETDCLAGCFAANQCAYAKFDDIRFYDNELTQSQISSECYLLISVKEYNQLSASISPNPCRDFLKITNKDNVENLEVEISSIDGKILKKVVYKNEKEAMLNVSELKSGVYFLTLRNNENTSTVKFIKE